MSVEVTISPEAEKILTERGIPADKVKEVVSHAEATGEKICIGNRCIGKKTIDEVTFYAQYTVADGKATVESAWMHRMKILKPVAVYSEDLVVAGEPRDISDWVCGKCNEKMLRANVDMEYLGIVRAAPALYCQKCGLIIIEEYSAIGPIATAEGLFEKKRA